MSGRLRNKDLKWNTGKGHTTGRSTAERSESRLECILLSPYCILHRASRETSLQRSSLPNRFLCSRRDTCQSVHNHTMREESPSSIRFLGTNGLYSMAFRKSACPGRLPRSVCYV